MARRQAGQHELANGFSIPPQTWAQPLRRGIPPGGCSFGLGSGSEFNRLTGRVSASVASRVLPVKGFGLAARYSTAYFEIQTSRRLRCTGPARPCTCSCWCCTRPWPCFLAPATFSSCALTSRAANCAALALQDRAPSRRQRDYCAIRKASGDDSRGLPTQVPRRVSSQLKRDCADPRQRSKSIIAASQNLRPMTCRRGLWVFGATIENRSSPSATSASCGRLNKVVRPKRSWILVWLKWFVDTEDLTEARIPHLFSGSVPA